MTEDFDPKLAIEVLRRLHGKSGWRTFLETLLEYESIESPSYRLDSFNRQLERQKGIEWEKKKKENI